MTTTKSVKCLLGRNIVVGGGFWIVYAIGLAIYSVSTGALNGQDGAYCLGYFSGCGLTLTLAAAWILANVYAWHKLNRLRREAAGEISTTVTVLHPTMVPPALMPSRTAALNGERRKLKP